MPNPAHAEREALADLFLRVGPDAPTLCEGWRTSDLAAHLVLRERRPDAAIGIVAGPLADYTERVQQQIHDSHAWPDLVRLVRTGPPFLLRPLDGTINTVEYFVHHEDVLRASPDWTPRTLDPSLEQALWRKFRLLGRSVFRGAPVGVVLRSPGYGEYRPRPGTPAVTVTGPPGEVVLFSVGRRATAAVELEGDEAARTALLRASTGI